MLVLASWNIGLVVLVTRVVFLKAGRCGVDDRLGVFEVRLAVKEIILGVFEVVLRLWRPDCTFLGADPSVLEAATHYR